MRKRLQIVTNESELRGYEQAARAQGVPLSKWVRRALRGARRAMSGASIDEKIEAIRASARHQFPAPDIDQMLTEVERGFGQVRSARRAAVAAFAEEAPLS